MHEGEKKMAIYNYDWKGSYHYSGVDTSDAAEANGDIVRAKIQAAFEQALKETALQAFTEQWAKIGRTLQVNAITTTTDKLTVSAQYQPTYGNIYRQGWGFDGQVTVLVQFTTDVASTEHFSPQGWEELLLELGSIILAALGAHTLIAALVILALVIGIVGISWKLTGTSLWSILGGGGGGAGDIFTLGVLLVGGLFVLYLLMGKRKK